MITFSKKQKSISALHFISFNKFYFRNQPFIGKCMEVFRCIKIKHLKTKTNKTTKLKTKLFIHFCAAPGPGRINVINFHDTRIKINSILICRTKQNVHA